MTKPLYRTNQDALKIYFLSVENRITGSIMTDWMLDYTPNDVMSFFLAGDKEKNLDIRVLLEVPVEDVLERVGPTPTKLDKRSFINNLNYTKDFLLKNGAHKETLEKILKTL